MRVSIIVPVLNEAAMLSRLLASLERLAAEVVFVDGGSEDDSVALIEAAGYRCLVAPRGRAAQMNAGAAATGGEILIFQHADTILPRGAINAVRHALDNGAVGGSFDVRLDSPRPFLRLVGAMITLRSRLSRISTGDQGLFIRRDAFEHLGGFVSQPLFEDVDMCRRLRRLGKIVRIGRPVVTSARRWQRHGAVRTVGHMWLLRTLYALGVDPGRLVGHYEATR